MVAVLGSDLCHQFLQGRHALLAAQVDLPLLGFDDNGNELGIDVVLGLAAPLRMAVAVAGPRETLNKRISGGRIGRLLNRHLR